MINGLSLLDTLGQAWTQAILRASVEGGVAILLVAGLTLALRRLPAGARCWLWRLALSKMLFAMWWIGPVEVPVLPPPPAQPTAVPIPHIAKSNDASGPQQRSRPGSGFGSRLPLGSRAWSLAQPVRSVQTASRTAGPTEAGPISWWRVVLFLGWLLGIAAGGELMLR